MKQQDIKEEFIEECHFALDFLVTEYDFSQPVIDEISHHTVDVTYYKKEVAIECSLDVRDEMCSFRIIRLESGKKPAGWRVNERGEVFAEYLISLLIHKGIRDLGIRFAKNIDINGLSNRQAGFRKVLLGDAQLLRLYGQDILNGSAKIFEGYNEAG